MPSGVAAIEYRSDFVKRCTVTPTRPMRIGTTVTRTTSSPVALMIEAGYGLSKGLWFLLLMNVGAIVGLVVAGHVGDSIGLKPAAILWFLASAGLLAALSVRVPVLALYPLVFVTGCFVFSAQVLVYAYAASNHPPAIRATALGMAAGIGRLGAISGPLLGGTLVSLGIGHPWGFYVFAAVGLIAAIAITTTQVMRQRV